jgi:glucan phosphoethanolaminetransferase (alkaline phosphatase superfamily)
MLPPIAAATSAVDSMKQIPPATWFKLGIGLAAFVVAIIILRKIARMNKIVLGVIVFVVVSVVFFSWVYNRNEPKWLTPVVERIAPFFPSAGSYSQKQQSNPKP